MDCRLVVCRLVGRMHRTDHDQPSSRRRRPHVCGRFAVTFVRVRRCDHQTANQCAGADIQAAYHSADTSASASGLAEPNATASAD
jgi:hypothetical protein